MAIKQGDKGSEVKKLQQAILDLGYALPRWGADGDLGTETIGVLARLMQDHGKKFDDDDTKVSDKELAFVFGLQNAAKQSSPLPVAEGMFFDRRTVSSKEHIYGRRSWKVVTGICLHQTACNLGEKPGRWDTVGCHVGITKTGKVIYLHDFDFLIVHGNGWNAQTVGIEMDGLYEGIAGDASTVWNDPSTSYKEKASPITPELVQAGLATVRWIVNEVARHGGKVKALVAHRQSSGTRRNDPGSGLWKAVALPLHKELGLTDGGKGFKLGAGYPIPEAWNPAHTGVKY